ncbi:hypothetical protein EVAR_22605_1 [Eumeta japonica]|uniref:Uncharacterized protein n=1 Tax=Eumeta variegata TaxID=151549 RepID=A0A4C1U7M1_EUMVA|nr:hypothetical protein EVAR_22605_1 [Eumeta japonica]
MRRSARPRPYVAVLFTPSKITSVGSSRRPIAGSEGHIIQQELCVDPVRIKGRCVFSRALQCPFNVISEAQNECFNLTLVKTHRSVHSCGQESKPVLSTSKSMRLIAAHHVSNCINK